MSNYYYQPYDTENNYDPNTGYGYGPTDGTHYGYGLTGDYANADWGVYNAIANGGNVSNLWHTLSYREWEYIFDSRNTPSGIRYAMGSVNGVNGVILLPDSWDVSIYALNYTNASQAPFTVNTITLVDWESLEANGAVFLPAAGSRGGTSVYSAGSVGSYWSVTPNSIGEANNIIFGSGTINFFYRYHGRSVRLVQNVQ